MAQASRPPLNWIEIESLNDPRVADYRNVKDAQLRRRQGLFVVEGRGSLRCMIEESPYPPLSLLLNHAAATALAGPLATLAPETPIYLASRELMNDIAGFNVHRGVLAMGRNDPARSVESLLASLATRSDPRGDTPVDLQAPSLIVVLEDVSDPDNIGQVFRNSLAFGVAAVILSPHASDPLYRKAIRTSMGATLRIPFARAKSWPDETASALAHEGYALVALDPGGRPISSLHSAGESAGLPMRAALAFGSEGHGLSGEWLERADLLLRIDMVSGMDSLNVATASGIALQLFYAASTRSAAISSPSDAPADNIVGRR